MVTAPPEKGTLATPSSLAKNMGVPGKVGSKIRQLTCQAWGGYGLPGIVAFIWHTACLKPSRSETSCCIYVASFEA